MMTERGFSDFVGIAQSRNKLIPKIKEEKTVLWPRNPKKTAMINRLWLNGYTVASITVHGVDNLYEANEISKNTTSSITVESEIRGDIQKEGDEKKKELHSISNHQTDLDHNLRRKICQRVGLGDFADRFIFAAGLKMKERWWVEMFMPGENALMVATPFDLQAIGEAFEWTETHRVSEEIKEQIALYKHNCNDLNRIAARRMTEAVRREGGIFYYYPESTRSRDGLFGRAQEEVGVYLEPGKKTEKYVLPMVVDGLNAVYPNRKIPRMWRRADVLAVVGKPFPVEELKEISLEGINFPDGSPATLADAAMARLAVLCPELVKLEEYAIYQQILGGYDPQVRGVYSDSHRRTVSDLVFHRN